MRWLESIFCSQYHKTYNKCIDEHNRTMIIIILHCCRRSLYESYRPCRRRFPPVHSLSGPYYVTTHTWCTLQDIHYVSECVVKNMAFLFEICIKTLLWPSKNCLTTGTGTGTLYFYYYRFENVWKIIWHRQSSSKKCQWVGQYSSK